MCRTIFKYYK